MLSIISIKDNNHNNILAMMEADDQGSMELDLDFVPTSDGVNGEGESASSAGGHGPAASEIEGSDTISFNPPAYIQRYGRVHDVLMEMLDSPKYKNLNVDTGKTIMEVGCAEFGMMRFLKGILDIGKIIFVDLDKYLLEEKKHWLKPLPAEYLQKLSRPKPLVVEAYAGCVTKVDAELRRRNSDVWAVIGIEIIEHLHPHVLRGFEEAVFGVTAPHLVVVTTPNSEFNQVFNLPPGKFRHWDHKFEWSRKEFQQWCDKIVTEFSNYVYRIEGICEGPEETRHLGCVSQMAIFERKECFSQIPTISPYLTRIEEGAYTLIQSVEFPNYNETRTPEKIILDEFLYFSQHYLLNRSTLNEYEENGVPELEYPVHSIQTIPNMPSAVLDFPLLVNVLQNGGYFMRNNGHGELCVVFDIGATIAANDKNSSDEDDDEQHLCVDMDELNVNRISPEAYVEEESWE